MTTKLKSLPPTSSDAKSNLEYVKSEIISIKDHPHYNEAWLHERIKEDTTILGLGDLDIRDHERRQPRAGRLDLLLENIEDKKRYEVEIQLGATDESHLIRTIEYWDNEKKRFPQYEHCAVIIAEDVTTRFLNVINLFNGYIPLIAIQVKAVKIGSQVSLFFTKVVNEVELGYLEDESSKEPEKDRMYWESKASPTTLDMMDKVFGIVSKKWSGYVVKYNKHYVGLFKDSRAQNFIRFKPNKANLNLAVKCQIPEDMLKEIESHDIEVLKYNTHWKEQVFCLNESAIATKQDVIARILDYAYNEYYE